MNIFKYKVFFIPLLGIIILIFFFIKGCLLPIVNKIGEVELSKEDIEFKKKTAYKEYTNLLSEETRRKIRLNDSYIMKSKYPYLSFGYDRKFEIGIYKLKMKEDIPLIQFVQSEKKFEKNSKEVIYEGDGLDNYFRFRISPEYDSIVDKVYFTYYDSLLQINGIGDSILSYNLSGSNFSIRYKVNGINDIVFSTEQNSLATDKLKRQNITISFYKKGSYVFLIFIYPYKPSLKMDDLFLLRLLDLNVKKL